VERKADACRVSKGIGSRTRDEGRWAGDKNVASTKTRDTRTVEGDRPYGDEGYADGRGRPSLRGRGTLGGRQNVAPTKTRDTRTVEGDRPYGDGDALMGIGR